MSDPPKRSPVAPAAAKDPSGDWIGAERRSEPRLPTLLRGRLFYGIPQTLWADCTVRDLSTRGAKIEVAAVHNLSSRLTLLNVSEGLAHPANLRWRRGDLAGLAFQATHDLKAESAPDEFAALRELYRALRGG